MDEHHDQHHYGAALMVIGWIAITCGTFMWQGKWPAVAAFGLSCLLWGLTLVLIAAMKEERSERRETAEDRAAPASAKA